ncbi:MAG: DUF3043 domain-containing protein [Actinomycetales bacterium]|nr:DUF3043 domain-containing protein [Actinomycetales bacterium]
MSQETPEQTAAGKGKPTPTRAEAEAARKAALNPVLDKKAARAAQREAREKARLGLLAGDERYFPARDRGPAKAFVRDFIDSRLTVGEVFLPAAFIVIVLTMVPNKTVLNIAYPAWFATFTLMLVDTLVVSLRLRSRLAKQFDPADRKGAIFYGVLRVTQMRKLRVPPPRVGIGGKPVKRKR